MQDRDSTKGTGPLAYRPAGAAKAIGIGRTKLYALIKAGEIGAVRYGNLTMIPAADILAFLARHRSDAAAGAGREP